ncbi:winged helix-turn-helix transcriptional regulator [Candidatus Bathyarchaeota archaeon]|nr:winged helix-turn-helix transcriptional regulator [Candidatus Bathyarchaeota archaeon]
MDEIDKKIISQLQINGRVSLKKLSEITGLSNTGVKKRLNKLVQNGLVKISALVNAEVLKLQTALVLMEVESSDAMNRLIERFKNCPRVVNLFTTLGGYNLAALIVAENRETLESISIEKCSLRSGEGIRRSEFYPISEIHYAPFIFLREYLIIHVQNKAKIAPCNVDCGPCSRYIANKCVGCPNTYYYKGPL